MPSENDGAPKSDSAEHAGPGGDVFYRETLKSLNRELAKMGGAVYEHKRIAVAMLERTDALVIAVKEMVHVGKDTRDVMREIRDELAAWRAERAAGERTAGERKRTPSTAPAPIAIARTQTGG